MISVEQKAEEEDINARPKSPTGQVLPGVRIGGIGGISNHMVSQEADVQRITLRPTEDAAFARLDDWPKKKS